MSKILYVTGSRGFIGTNFCNKLLKDYNDIIIVSLDKRTYAANYSLVESPRFRDYMVDINNKESVNNIFRSYKYHDSGAEVIGLINFAAESHVDNSIKNPEPFLSANYSGVLNLLDLWMQWYPTKRFVQISTDEVYGSVTEPCVETDPLNPSSVYSATKAGAELLCRSFLKTYSDLKPNIVITRCGNNFGPYQHTEKFIPKIITNALNNKKIPVYGEGLNVRQWTSVKNHVNCIWDCFLYGVSGEVYNVGGGDHVTNIDIVKNILDRLDKDESLIQFVEDRKGHDLMYSIDCSKFENIASHPPITFDDALDDTIQFYTEHNMRLDGIRVDN